MSKKHRQRQKEHAPRNQTHTGHALIGHRNSHQHDGEPTAQDGNNRNRPAKEVSMWKTLRDWMNADVWMVILTIILSFIAYLQWRVSKDTLEIANRAYITITESSIRTVAPTPTAEGLLGKIRDEVRMAGPLKAGDIVALEVKVRNSGTTPAVDFTPKAHIGLENRLPFRGMGYPDAGTNTQTFGVSTDSTMERISTLARDDVTALHGNVPARLTAEHIAAINGGKLFLQIYGVIAYRDVFDVDRTTGFCRMFDASTLDMVPCPGTHNWID